MEPLAIRLSGQTTPAKSLVMPRYSEYKASGVEWLGEVPGHWEVKRLKQVCHVFPSNVDKKSHDGEMPVSLCNYTNVYYNNTITTDMEFMAATASTEQIAKFTLRAGDTIITKDSETNRAIELLQERRSALISAAVTGKIDVCTLSHGPSPMPGEGSIKEAI